MATEYAFVDDSGTTRLEGFLVPEPGGSRSAIVTLDSGDLIGQTTVELIAPPGAGKGVVPVNITAMTVVGSTPYADDGTNAIGAWDGATVSATYTSNESLQLTGATPGTVVVVLYHLVDSAFSLQTVDAPSGQGMALTFDVPPADGNGSVVFTITYLLLTAPV